MDPANRIQSVQTPVIPVVGEWVAQHPGTISLGQGVVHYAPPAQVAAAVVEHAGQLATSRYGLVRGTDPLLAAAEQKLVAENGAACSEGACVVWTAGSNMAFMNAVLAIADVGDEIVLLSPYYFNHEMAIEIAGCRAVAAPTDDQYQPDLDAIQRAITPRTRAVVTISPNNPTGAVYDQTSLTAINQLCRQRGIYHISDEAYEYFVFGDSPHFSPASLEGGSEHTISLFSLSKAYGMAGWRTGYMLIPQHLETSVKKIQDTNLICPPIISQVAALAALEVGSTWCAEQIAGFRNVRELVLHELHSLGERCRVPQPDGAFYALVQVETDQSDMDLVHSLIRDFGVAVMPGSTFGVRQGCSLRIAFGALNSETVAAGMSRFTSGLKKLL